MKAIAICGKLFELEEEEDTSARVYRERPINDEKRHSKGFFLLMASNFM